MTVDTDLATLREDSALLADWAEEPTSMPSVDVDAVRARMMGAAENLEAEIARLQHENHRLVTYRDEETRAFAVRAEAAERELARLREGLREKRDIAEKEPLNVDISDYSDEWCAGFLEGQAHALDEARALLAEDNTA